MDSKQKIMGFDSAPVLLKSLSHFLRGQEFYGLEIVPKPLMPIGISLLKLINRLPKSERQAIVGKAGTLQGFSSDELGRINEEQIASWMVEGYPRRQYPGIAIGSSNGALIHAFAALGIPWLPQTFLVLGNRADMPTDELAYDLEVGIDYATTLLTNNSKIKIFQMNDPSQDRHMSRKMCYFRIKYANIPVAYQQYMEQTLQPGGTIVIVECQKQWPVTKVSERHSYQVGGIGGTSVAEYFHGGRRVREFLEREGSPHRQFVIPTPNTYLPEAEWGFEQAIRQEILHFAQQHGYKVKRLVFNEPEDASHVVAGLYKWWYQKIGLPTRRLIVGSFILIDPSWALRNAFIPFWTVFNGENSLNSIKNYLDQEEFDTIYLTPFSNIIQSIGVPDIIQWSWVIKQAKKEGRFIAVNEDEFPFDVTTSFTYNRELKKISSLSRSLPEPLTLEQLDRFFEDIKGRFGLQWMSG